MCSNTRMHCEESNPKVQVCMHAYAKKSNIQTRIYLKKIRVPQNSVCPKGLTLPNATARSSDLGNRFPPFRKVSTGSARRGGQSWAGPSRTAWHRQVGPPSTWHRQVGPPST